MSADSLRLAVFGQPIAHSLSPLIHALFGAQTGLDVDYRAHETGPGTLRAALAHFHQEGGTGCNVTLPLKAEAAQLAQTISERVQLAGAANTLLWRDRGWHADNTDGLGLVADLQRLGLNPAGQRIALIGAGGAAAGVLGALLATGPAELTIYNRTLASAEALRERHGAPAGLRAAALQHLPTADGIDLLINATSQGHRGDLPPLPEQLTTGSAVYDLNYGPAAAGLLSWCQQHAVPAHDGLGMLVAQAAESFYRWTGVRPEFQPVLERLQAQRGD